MDETEGENANNVMAYFGRVNSEGESSNEDRTKVELDAFRIVLTKWEKARLTVDSQKKTIGVL